MKTFGDDNLDSGRKALIRCFNDSIVLESLSWVTVLFLPLANRKVWWSTILCPYPGTVFVKVFSVIHRYIL